MSLLFNLVLKSLVALAGLGLASTIFVMGLRLTRRITYPPTNIGTLRKIHRTLGLTSLVLFIGVHLWCMYVFGIGLYSPRATVHTIFGFFGFAAYTAKIYIVETRRAYQIYGFIGGSTLLTTWTIVVATSAIWFLLQ